MAEEKTLILIKPDAIRRRLTGLTIDCIESTGLELIASKVVSVSDKLAREHYKELSDKPFFESLIKFIRGEYHQIPNHKVFAFIYKGENAVEIVREVVGVTNPEQAAPETIRGRFGRIKNGIMENVIHASSSYHDAQREIALWFSPEEIVE